MNKKIILVVDGNHGSQTMDRWLNLLKSQYDTDVEVIGIDEYNEMKKVEPDFFIFDELPTLAREELKVKNVKEKPIWQKKNRWT